MLNSTYFQLNAMEPFDTAYLLPTNYKMIGGMHLEGKGKEELPDVRTHIKLLKNIPHETLFFPSVEYFPLPESGQEEQGPDRVLCGRVERRDRYGSIAQGARLHIQEASGIQVGSITRQLTTL